MAANGNLSVDYPGVCVRLIGDRTVLKKLLQDTTTPVQRRAAVFYDFQFVEDVSPEEVFTEYKKLVLEDPDNWRTRREYAKYLDWKKRYKEAQDVIVEWLKTNDDSAGFDYINARAQLAELYYKENKYLKGWEAVQPVVSSWQQYAMQQGALIRDALGDKEGALDLARASADRYPQNIESPSDLMQIMWHNQMDQEAATVLESYGHRIRDIEWCDRVATKFIKVFENRTPEESLNAFRALVSSKTSGKQQLGCIAYKMSDLGKSEAAFLMVEELHKRKLATLSDLIIAYKCLESYKGETEAVKWLNSQLPKKKQAIFSVLAYRERAYGMLWNYFNPTETNDPCLVWLMRAAHTLFSEPKGGKHWKMLHDYYSSKDSKQYAIKHPSSNPYFEIGKYLVDLNSIDQALASVKDQKTFCKAAYFFAQKACSNLQLKEAQDWYTLALETGDDQNLGYVLSRDVLVDWKATTKNLAYQKRRWENFIQGKSEDKLTEN